MTLNDRGVFWCLGTLLVAKTANVATLVLPR